MGLLVVSVVFTIYNRYVMIENTKLKAQTEMLKSEFNNIFSNTLRLMDLGLRGYALTGNEGLLSPYKDALRGNAANLRRIDSLLTIQKLDTTIRQFGKFKQELAVYLEHSEHMREVAQQGDKEEFVRLLDEDKGYDLYLVYAPINAGIIRYENSLIEQSQQNYERAMNRNVFFQIFLVLLGVPTLAFVMIRIKRETKERDELLRDFERNNRQYLFNPGTEEDRKVKAQEIIGNSIENLKQASSFIKNITSGNYAVEWEGITPKNDSLNKENVVGHLTGMRDEMKRVKKEDQERLWVTEGLAQFSEIVRNNQKSVDELTNAVVRYLTQYLKAQQGSLFVLNEDEGGEQYLLLASCFAFDKKKFVEKRIDMGSGLIGQACMDGNTVLLTEIPQRYISITSGLGEATPTCLLIVPMKYNEKVECLFEVASFTKFEPYQISFLEKAGEFVASAIFSVRSNEHTGNLLKAAQENSEMMRSQEEEMRQNMEELQATQEEMARKESESARILEECRANEKVLKRKLDEFQKQRN